MTPTAAPTTAVSVRHFAGARAAAGTDQEVYSLPAGSVVDDLVEAMAARHGSDLARVLGASSFLVDGVAGSRDRALAGAVEVDVLPPFAGG
jgi:molybdopterin converting factor small subunit